MSGLVACSIALLCVILGVWMAAAALNKVDS